MKSRRYLISCVIASVIASMVTYTWFAASTDTRRTVAVSEPGIEKIPVMSSDAGKINREESGTHISVGMSTCDISLSKQGQDQISREPGERGGLRALGIPLDELYLKNIRSLLGRDKVEDAEYLLEEMRQTVPGSELIGVTEELIERHKQGV